MRNYLITLNVDNKIASVFCLLQGRKGYQMTIIKIWDFGLSGTWVSNNLFYLRRKSMEKEFLGFIRSVVFIYFLSKRRLVETVTVRSRCPHISQIQQFLSSTPLQTHRYTFIDKLSLITIRKWTRYDFLRHSSCIYYHLLCFQNFQI